jgi:hypothetical protein
MGMREVVQYVAWALGLWLNVVVLAALLRGGYREYPFVFVYALALLLATVIEIAAYTLPHSSIQSVYYWTDEVILDVLVFCVVIAFIDRAAQDAPQRPIARQWLIAGAAIISLVSFWAHSGQNLNRQWTLVSRDLNLCAVGLDVILWSVLIAARRPNRRLLLLSGGLGLQLTGAIMGASLRNLSRRTSFAGSMLEVITGLLGLYIWWRALKPSLATQQSLA